MLLPALSSARAKAKAANCMSNLKQIGIALAQYEMDFNGLPYMINVAWPTDGEALINGPHPMWDPKTKRWDSVLYNYFLTGTGYMQDEEFFTCPAYSSKEADPNGVRCNFAPNVAVFALNTTDRYPGAIYLGDGYTAYRLRCRNADYSFR